MVTLHQCSCNNQWGFAHVHRVIAHDNRRFAPCLIDAEHVQRQSDTILRRRDTCRRGVAYVHRGSDRVLYHDVLVQHYADTVQHHSVHAQRRFAHVQNVPDRVG